MVGLAMLLFGMLADPAPAQQLLVAEGSVYTWQPGAADWWPAELNTLLDPGDALYAGEGATAELLIGPNDFARLASKTQLSLVANDAGLMQLRVSAGVASFDLRSPLAGRIVEVDTPNAAFALGGSGYYRVDVQGSRTRFLTRRGGRATLTLADGRSRIVTANEEIVVEGSGLPVLQNRLVVTDTWDRWNDARSDYYMTNGIGIVWIDGGRREHRPRPAPHWDDHERRDFPSPPVDRVRPIPPPRQTWPQPTPPVVRPPEPDRGTPHRDLHGDDQRNDHGRERPRPEPSAPPAATQPMPAPAPVGVAPRQAPVTSNPAPSPPARAVPPSAQPAPQSGMPFGRPGGPERNIGPGSWRDGNPEAGRAPNFPAGQRFQKERE
jgi:hypothetical protein